MKYLKNTFLNKMYMLFYNISEGTDINKTNASKECDICHYLYFWNKDFRFQSNVLNRCYGLLMMPANLNNIYILNIKDANYRCIINGISKSEAKDYCKTLI